MAGGEGAALEDGLHEVHAEVVAEVDVVGRVQDHEVGLLARLEAAHAAGLADGPGGVDGGRADRWGYGLVREMLPIGNCSASRRERFTI